MEDILLFYAEANKERVSLFMAIDHPSKGLVTNISHLTLIFFSRSQQLF